MTAGLKRFNEISREAASAELMKCCGSNRWAATVAASRPFNSLNDLISTSTEVFRSLTNDDWLEAFRHHPKIGEKKAEREQTSEELGWSKHEQQSAAAASDELLDELKRLNAEYDQRFGYIFIVCATGKTTSEIIELLRLRIANDADSEIRIAACEQQKIAELRLAKLLEV